MAILIEASEIAKHDPLPGAKTDVQTYSAWLKSDFGGAWNDNEVIVLSHPTKSTLQRCIQVASLCDYSLVTFSGHGYHAVGKRVDETRLLINSTEETTVLNLNPGNSHSLIVADACRRVSYIDAEKQARAFVMALSESAYRVRPNRQRCRDLFDATVARAEKGPIYFYSCDLDEAAADVPSFSEKLVEAGQNWSEHYRDQDGLFPSNVAFISAAAEITERNPQQHPQSQPGRRTVHFPWGVVAH